MNIPSGVSAIEDEVFYGCTALQNINVSGDNPSLKSVDGVLFTKNGEELLFYPAGRTQTSYAVPAGVEIIQAYAFAGCESLLQIDLPESLWRISYYAFENTGLRYVIIPQGVEHINSQAFACCRSLTYAVIPAGLTYLGYDVFLDYPLQRVDFGGSEEEWNALIDPETGSYNEELENAAVSFNSGYIPAENPLIMPADLAVIEDAAFEGGAFTHVYLNAGVVSIGSRAFANCPHLRCVSILNADVSIASDAFDGSYFVVIVCAEGSSAHQFAIEHGIAYQIIGAAD